jgi:hypothetical protein
MALWDMLCFHCQDMILKEIYFEGILRKSGRGTQIIYNSHHFGDKFKSLEIKDMFHLQYYEIKTLFHQFNIVIQIHVMCKYSAGDSKLLDQGIRSKRFVVLFRLFGEFGQ